MKLLKKRERKYYKPNRMVNLTDKKKKRIISLRLNVGRMGVKLWSDIGVKRKKISKKRELGGKWNRKEK
jgi:hypothetical protein